LSRARLVPARTRTRRAARSTPVKPESAPSSTLMPAVTAAALKEWPLPTGFTVAPAAAACRTTSATESALVGRATEAAVTWWLPAQLRQAAPLSLAIRGEYPSRKHGVNWRLQRVRHNKGLVDHSDIPGR